MALIPVVLFGEPLTTLDGGRLLYNTDTGQIVGEGTGFVARHFDVFRGANTGRLISWQPPNFVDQNTGQLLATTADLLRSAPQPAPGTSPGTMPSDGLGKILPYIDPTTGLQTCPKGYLLVFGQCMRLTDLLLGIFGVTVAVSLLKRR